MPRKTRNQIEFNAGELIRRLEGVAKHARGQKHLTMRATRMALPPPREGIFHRR